jgi:hypothetical protein
MPSGQAVTCLSRDQRRPQGEKTPDSLLYSRYHVVSSLLYETDAGSDEGNLLFRITSSRHIYDGRGYDKVA